MVYSAERYLIQYAICIIDHFSQCQSALHQNRKRLKLRNQGARITKSGAILPANSTQMPSNTEPGLVIPQWIMGLEPFYRDIETKYIPWKT